MVVQSNESEERKPSFLNGQHSSCGCDGYDKHRGSNDADAEAENEVKVIQVNESELKKSLW